MPRVSVKYFFIGISVVVTSTKFQTPPRSAVAVSPAHGNNASNTLAIRLREGEKESQIPNFKQSLEFEIWNSFGIWCLGFDTHQSPSKTYSIARFF